MNRATLKARIAKIEEDLRGLKKQVEPTKWFRIGELFWLTKCSDKEMNWEEALKWCSEQGGRLPERWEMVKAFDENEDEIQELIEADPSNSFWSVTEDSGTTAWNVYLSNGYTSYYNKATDALYVRAVRDIL